MTARKTTKSKPLLEEVSKVAKKIANNAPGQLKHYRDEFTKTAKALAEAQLAKLNFVSREEFDVQRKVLAGLRDKLTKLEKQLSDLNKKLPK